MKRPALGRSAITSIVALLALYVGVVVVLHSLLERPYTFVDLDVYRWGGSLVRDDGSLYDVAVPSTGLRFTYPPFAALLFGLLDDVGLLREVTFSAVSLLALARTAWVLALNRGTLFASRSTWQVAAGFAAIGLLVEPGNQNVILGQVSFLLTWMVVEGLLGIGSRSPLGAAGIGLAAAIKLTPALFFVYLAVAGRWRAMCVALGTFVVAGALAWAVVPADSRDFWFGDGLAADRVGAVEYVANQSIDGVLWRLAGEGGIRWLWLLGSLVVVVASCWIARRSSVLVAVGVIGLASVLVAPISWTHHWVAVLPLLVGLAGTSSRWTPALRVLVVAILIVFASRGVWHVPQGDGAEFDLGFVDSLIASSYVVIGFTLLVASALATQSDTTFDVEHRSS